MKFGSILFQIAILILAYPLLSWGGAVITYHGRILDANKRPVENGNVFFKIRVYSPNPGKCLLYEETRTLDMTNSQGVFVIPIGDGQGLRTTADPGIQIEKVFANDPNTTFNTTNTPKLLCNSGSSYTPGALDQRHLSVSFDDNTGKGEQALPLMDVNFVPLAVSSFEAQNVGGVPATSVVRVSGGVASSLTPANFAELLNLLNGTTLQYEKVGRLNGQNLPVLSNGQVLGWNGSWTAVTPLTSYTETDPTVKAFAKSDLPLCAANEFLKDNGSGSLTCAAVTGASGGTVTSITAGTGLTGGTITSSGTLAVDVGTGANQIVQMGSDAKLPAVDGSKLTNVVASGLSSTASINTSGNIQTSGSVTAVQMNARYLYIENTTPNRVTLQAPASFSDYTWILPVNQGTSGQVLAMGTAGQLEWIAPSTGSVTNVTATAPLSSTGGATPNLSLSQASATTSGYLSATDWSTFNDKLGTSSSFAGDVSGTSSAMSVDKIKGQSVVPTTYATGQTLRYDGTNWVNALLGFGDLSGTIATSQLPVIPVSKGGTGVASFAANRLLASDGTGNALTPFTCGVGELLTFDVAGVMGCTSYSASGIFANGGNSFAGAATLGTNDTYDLNFETNGTTRMTVTAGGNVGIGTSGPTSKLDIDNGEARFYLMRTQAQKQMDSSVTGPANELYGADFHIIRSSDDAVSWAAAARLYTFSNSTTRTSDVAIRRGRGTLSAPQYVLMNDRLGTVTLSGITPEGTFVGESHGGASIVAIAAEDHNSTTAGTHLRFQTTSSSAIAPSDKMTLTASGNLGIGNTNPTAPLHVSKNFSSSSTSEEYGIFSGTTFTQNSTNWKAGIRTNTAPGHTSGTLSKVVGVQSLISSGGSGGTTTDAVALWGRVDTGTGQLITNAYSFFAENGSGSGAPANLYGLYVQPLTKGSTENFAIYTAGSTKSYFGGRVGVGTTSPAVSLDLGSKTDALRLPNGTTAQQPASPADGMIRYNTTTSLAEIYQNGSWVALTTSAGGSSVTTDSSGAVNITAGGANQNVTLQASGVGSVTSPSVLTLTGGQSSTSSSNGALVVTGGVGVSGNINSGGDIYSSGSLTAGLALYAPLIYGGTAASGTLALDSTSNATKGKIILAPSGGNVGIGTSAPDTTLHVYSAQTGSAPHQAGLIIEGEGDTYGGRIATRMYSSTEAPHFISYRALGTKAAPTALTSGKGILTLSGRGYDGSGWSSSSSSPAINFEAAENWTTTAKGSRIVFKTTANASTSNAERMVVDSTGNVGIGASAPLLPLQVRGVSGTGGIGFNSNGFYGEQTVFVGDNQAARLYLKGLYNADLSQKDVSYILKSAGDVDTIQLSTNGNSFFNGGNLGIGTTAPDNKLTVAGGLKLSPTALTTTSNVSSAAEKGLHMVSDSDYGGLTFLNIGADRKDTVLYFGDNSTDNLRIMGTNSSNGHVLEDRMIITNSGMVGIGTTSPTYKLDVAGDINTSTCFRIGATTVSGTCTSDARLKENIRDYTQGLKELLNIQLRTYQFNGLGEMPKTGEIAVGVIAQEVEKTNPDLVKSRKVKMHSEDTELTDIKVVNYSKFTYMLINAVKELYSKLVAMEAQQSSQDQQGATLRTEIEIQKKQNIAKDLKIQRLEEENKLIKSYLCEKDPSAQFCN